MAPETIADLATARTVIADLQAALARAEGENTLLRQKLDVLCHKLFGKKSEGVSDAQLRLAFAQLAEELQPRDEPTEMDTGERPGKQHRRPPRPTGRRPLPPALPRQRVEIDLPDADKVCPCGTVKTRIGEAVSEKLDYVPASVRVIETVRPKYACPRCHDGVSEAPAPPQAVERSLATEGLLAHVVVSKYLDHLPLYRLERIFQRQHLDLSRATLCGWVADVAAALTPIGDELRRQVTAASYIQTDDTPVTILEETGSRKGRIWTYLDPLRPQVVFDATPTHERDGPERFLADFAGDLQADAYTGYDALYRTGRIRELGCWAHARRGFVEALPTDARAARMLDLVQQLYQVERAAAEDSIDARRTRRQAQSVPLLNAIRGERDALAATVLPKSPLGEAVRYLTNQWDALQRFTDDGRFRIDNNGAENQLRGVAIGRKNWLFAGSFEGATRAALLYSLVQSCSLIGVSPFDYLKDVLIRAATHPHRLIGQLTPRGWADTFPQHAAA
ncbi:MAG TPA: IS66 family transposase [Vicinamibacterales bacterium]|nr:IS66 family transposase [Vicinamibacterales bacterium]